MCTFGLFWECCWLCSCSCTGNGFLYWAGASVFPIYIYQRLPMRALRHWAGDAWVGANPYVFILLCTGITGVIACFYKYWQIKLK